MNENRLSELLQQLVDKLRETHLQSLDSHPYFSLHSDSCCLLVDWNTGGLDIPNSVRIIMLDDDDGEPGYLGCIRFDVTLSEDTNESGDVQFTFDEAEYDLEGVNGRVTILETILGDIFSI